MVWLGDPLRLGKGVAGHTVWCLPACLPSLCYISCAVPRHGTVLCCALSAACAFRRAKRRKGIRKERRALPPILYVYTSYKSFYSTDCALQVYDSVSVLCMVSYNTVQYNICLRSVMKCHANAISTFCLPHVMLDHRPS